MPGVYGDGSLGATFRQVLQRLRALETQQQSVISDNLGRPVVTTGLIPGSNPPLYGYMVWDPNTNTRLMFQGYDSGSDTAYIAFYDSNGNIVNKFDQAGQHVYDDSGTEEVRLGLLNTSPPIYGLGVLPYGGTQLQQVGGTLFGFSGSTYTTTSTAWVAPPGAPSITAEIGPSERADVTIGAHIATGDVSQEGYIGLVVDGVTPPDFTVGTSESVGTGGISSDVFGRFSVTGLSVGTHTFAIEVWTANNATHNVGFSNLALTVSPL